MLSLGVFRILDKRESWWKYSDRLPGPSLGGVRGSSRTTSDLHQLASHVKGGGRVEVGDTDSLVTTGNSRWTRGGTFSKMTSSLKHQSSLLKSEHLGAQGVGSVVWC